MKSDCHALTTFAFVFAEEGEGEDDVCVVRRQPEPQRVQGEEKICFVSFFSLFVPNQNKRLERATEERTGKREEKKMTREKRKEKREQGGKFE